MKIAVFYKSFTGNTEKVTERIVDTLRKKGESPDVVKVSGDEDVELYDYDLVFLGTPVIEFLPARQILDFIKKQLSKHRKRGDIIPTSPKIPGKYAVCYLTYSGPHTGIREAVATMKYMEQFFEHLRFTVLGEWYVVGEFKNNEELSTKGVLGDIRGRPNEDDLKEVERKVEGVLRRIGSQEKSEIQGEFTPGALKLLGRSGDLLDKFRELQDAQRRSSSLDERTASLVRIVSAAVLRSEDCTKFFMLEALKNGVTDVEIRDALMSCMLIGGTGFMSFANNVMEEIGLLQNQ